MIDYEDVSDEKMNEMIDGTLTEFDEGDLVDGTVVKIEHDEVLVDIGFKSEGVIPSRELSIRKDADPSEIVSLGDKLEALVLQKEDKDGRRMPGCEQQPPVRLAGVKTRRIHGGIAGGRATMSGLVR